jgi:hypothetical protein
MGEKNFFYKRLYVFMNILLVDKLLISFLNNVSSTGITPLYPDRGVAGVYPSALNILFRTSGPPSPADGGIHVAFPSLWSARTTAKRDAFCR